MDPAKRVQVLLQHLISESEVKNSENLETNNCAKLELSPPILVYEDIQLITKIFEEVLITTNEHKYFERKEQFRTLASNGKYLYH